MINASGTGAIGLRMNGGSPKIDNTVISGSNGTTGVGLNTSGGGGPLPSM